MEEESKNQRLKKVRLHLGMDQEGFAAAAGITQGALSKIERGTPFSDKVIEALRLSKGVNPEYIENGEEPMILHNPSLRSVGYNAKKAIVPDTNTDNLYVIPIKAYGGFLAGYANKAYMDSLEKIPFPFVRGNCFAFEIEGFSMVSDDPKEDSYPPGSWVITTELENFSWLQKGKVYVFATIDGICIKEFLKLDDNNAHLRSKNKDSEYKMAPMPRKNIKKIFHIEFKMAKPFY